MSRWNFSESAYLSSLCSRVLGICAGLMALVLAASCVTPLPRQPQTIVVTATPAATAAPQHTQTPIPPVPSPTSASVMTENGAEGVNLLDVRGPLDGAVVQTGSVVVHGFANAASEVQVNGQTTEIDEEGHFQRVVELSPGLNNIQVVASGQNGESRSATLNVISLALPPQPFFLLITQPPENQRFVTHPDVLLAGRTTPETMVSVNGVAIPVDVVGVFSTTITLDPGPNIINVLGTNIDGEVVSETIILNLRQ